MVGWEARHDRIDPVGLYHTIARQRLDTVRRDFVRETSDGVFAEGEARFTSWLRAIAGVRYDHYFFDVTSDNPANSGRADAGRISPKASAIFGSWAKTELFANFGLGFHSNDARGVNTTVDPRSGDPVSKVTPLVGTRGAEVGMRTEIVPAVQASLALWRLDLDSGLLFTGDAGTTEPSRASRRQGIEFNTQWYAIRWLLFDLDLVARAIHVARSESHRDGRSHSGRHRIRRVGRRHHPRAVAQDRERLHAPLRAAAAHRGR